MIHSASPQTLPGSDCRLILKLRDGRTEEPMDGRTDEQSV